MSYLPTRNEFDALSRISLAIFIQRVFAELHPSTPFQDNWHIDLIVQHLEDARAGRTRRLAINLPPRSLKSILISVAYPAWLLGQDPSVKVICASYGDDLAIPLARMCLQVMQSEWYRKQFPRTRLTSTRPSAESFSTTAGGGRIATSVGGTLVGLGGDYILIDDPIKPLEVSSDTLRQSVNNWYSHSVVTRLDNKNRGVIILLTQRLHDEDLTGYVLAQGGWTHVSLSAIAQEVESYEINTPFGILRHRRLEGEALHPGRESLETLARQRTEMGSEFFAAQYLQFPTPPGGGLIKIVWFSRYRSRDLPETFDGIVQSWDIGQKAANVNDPSVCTTWGIKGKNVYLLHVLRIRQEYPDLKRTIVSMQREYRAHHVLIEDKTSGTPLIQDLKRDGLWQVKGVIPHGDKVQRMQIQTALIESGFVWIPEDATWLPDYLHELMMFPRGRHDDQVDSTAQALQFFNEQRNTPGLLGYYQERAANARTKEAHDKRLVTIKGPVGRTLMTRSGERYFVGLDGLLRLPWADAKLTLRYPEWSLVDDPQGERGP